MAESKNIGIWIRVSTEDQAKGESPEHHEKRARYYAESKGWTIREVYRLEAVSGKSVMEHPETKRMLADIRSHKITGIIFSKLARLARNTRELLDFADIFRECDADLVSLQESIDTSTPAGRLFYTMIAAMAQWEREEISERVAASVPIRAKLGKPLGGAAPFGFKWVDKKLIPEPKEAPVRTLLYELFQKHRRKKKVARLLNESGYRTRNGGLFSDTTVDRLLRDPIAKGLRRANYTKGQGNKKNWKIKPESEWIFTEVEGIVSEGLWDECNAILDAQADKYKRAGRSPQHLFSGYVFCTCGSKMYKQPRSPNYSCRKCKTKIDASALEGIYHDQIKLFLMSDEEVRAKLDEAESKIKEKESLVQSLTKEADRIKAEMDRIMNLYVKNEIEEKGFGRHYQPLELRLKQIEDQIPELMGEMDYLKILNLSRDEVIEEGKQLYSRWETMGSEQKRSIIQTITEKITIGTDEVAIDLAYDPAVGTNGTKGQRNLRGSLHRQA